MHWISKRHYVLLYHSFLLCLMAVFSDMLRRSPKWHFLLFWNKQTHAYLYVRFWSMNCQAMKMGAIVFSSRHLLRELIIVLERMMNLKHIFYNRRIFFGLLCFFGLYQMDIILTKQVQRSYMSLQILFSKNFKCANMASFTANIQASDLFH